MRSVYAIETPIGTMHAPLPILIPCHRVLYSHGKKQSYLGGPEMKEFLLELERRNR